jgi:hypothetical protein
MISSFPSSFCSDGGRAIINAGAPPINKPSKEEAARQVDEPDWRCRQEFAWSMNSGRRICSPVVSNSALGSSIIRAASLVTSACFSRGRRVHWKADTGEAAS